MLFTFIVVTQFYCEKRTNCGFRNIPNLDSLSETFVYIRQAKDKQPDCEFETIIDLWSDTAHYYSKGFVTIVGKRILFRATNSGYVNFLDFSIKAKERYIFTIRDTSQYFEFPIFVENKFTTKDRGEITVFRILNGFFDETGNSYDVVLVASLDSGILGSYLVGRHNGIEYFLHPKGVIYLKERGMEGVEFRKIR